MEIPVKSLKIIRKNGEYVLVITVPATGSTAELEFVLSDVQLQQLASEGLTNLISNEPGELKDIFDRLGTILRG